MNANSRDVNHCQCERLAPALNRLLESCIEIKTTNTKILAEYLCRSPATIRTQFQRILILMDVHCRYEALRKAEEKGWVRCGCRPSAGAGFADKKQYGQIQRVEQKAVM